jgi:hypothetical protein
MTFTADLTKFAKRADLNTETLIRAASSEISASVISRTPVDKGRLKNSWMFSNTGYSGGSRSALVSGAESSANMRTVVNNMVGGVLYASNNLPYAYGIEFDGKSKIKAPAGMVRVSFADYNNALKKAARNLP